MACGDVQHPPIDMNIHAPTAAVNVRPKAEVHVNKQAVTRQAVEWLVVYKNVGRSFLHSVTIHAFDRQSDRQTDCSSQAVAAVFNKDSNVQCDMKIN